MTTNPADAARPSSSSRWRHLSWPSAAAALLLAGCLPVQPGQPAAPDARATPAAISSEAEPTPPALGMTAPATIPHAGYASAVFAWGADEDGPLVEVSGAAASSTQPSVLFVHNDSPRVSGDGPFAGLPDPFASDVFAVDVATGELLATIHLDGALNIDWEDMARGPRPDGASALWLADIGDNDLARDGGATVYVVAEPTVDLDDRNAAGTIDDEDVQQLILSYPDGARDAEAFAVHPVTGDIAVFSKERGRTAIYAATAAALTLDGAAVELTEVAVLTLPSGSSEVTGADWSPDGSRLVLSTYREVLEFDAVGADLAATVGAGPSRTMALPPDSELRQAEAIAYVRDGRDLLVLSESADNALARRPAYRLGELSPG